MTSATVAFIGAGNMARSLIGGLAAQAGFTLRAADPDATQLERISERYAVSVANDNAQCVAPADVVVIAVKPQTVRGVVTEIADTLRHTRALLISVAAGVRASDITRWLGHDAAVVRCMPNTPALVGSGISALAANPHVTSRQRALAEVVLKAVGSVMWVQEEATLDAVTAVSGSGPAYFFAVMEAMQAAGEQLGLSPDQARTLTIETALGAARMAMQGDEPPAQLRANVTSPGGTTAAALAVFEKHELKKIFASALAAARDRAVELGNDFGAS